MISNRSFFIRNKSACILGRELGGEVNVISDQATYTGTFPPQPPGSLDLVVLGNKTNEFMRKFQCQTFKQLDETQVQILRSNSDTVAYTRTKEKDYMVATKSRDMPGLKRQLFPDRNSKINPPWNDP